MEAKDVFGHVQCLRNHPRRRVSFWTGLWTQSSPEQQLVIKSSQTSSLCPLHLTQEHDLNGIQLAVTKASRSVFI